MKTLKTLALIILTLAAYGPAEAQTHRVRFTTDSGTFTVELFDDTPLHRDNFLRLVREGYYDGLLFHRVIKNFMVQAGDSTTRHAKPYALYGEGDVPYTLPAEIIFPRHYHHRGALAAAREADEVNPERRSSGAQFYVVTGSKWPSSRFADVRQYVSRMTEGRIQHPHALAEDYAERGGAPHLDGQYTVFGQVVEGMDIVEAISRVRTDRNDRPLEDLHIIHAECLE